MKGWGYEVRMKREELAEALNVWPWDVDDWLLWGCPAEKIRSQWEFNLKKVKIWIKEEKIKIRRRRLLHRYQRREFDRRWLRDRCPICIDRGFAGEKAGRVYTLGEVLEGEWHLRRAAIPCGHSAFLNPTSILEQSLRNGR